MSARACTCCLHLGQISVSQSKPFSKMTTTGKKKREREREKRDIERGKGEERRWKVLLTKKGKLFRSFFLPLRIWTTAVYKVRFFVE